jgi:hypothetical protein
MNASASCSVVQLEYWQLSTYISFTKLGYEARRYQYQEESKVKCSVLRISFTVEYLCCSLTKLRARPSAEPMAMINREDDLIKFFWCSFKWRILIFCVNQGQIRLDNTCHDKISTKLNYYKNLQPKHHNATHHKWAWLSRYISSPITKDWPIRTA